MAWATEDRTVSLAKTSETPYLTEEMKSHLRDVYFPRYPTKRAVLLPALHMVQHHYNWIPTQAIEEVAAFLEIAPSEALDTASFYEEYWLKPKGKYLLQVCRSFACELCQSQELTDHLCKKLGIEPGETTADGKFTLVELECLGACGSAPVAMINEVLVENQTPETLDQLINSLPDDPHAFRDPGETWNEGH
jgi:NADH-quinone oxidoreductase subunit E